MAAPYDMGGSLCGFDASYATNGVTDQTGYSFLLFTNIFPGNDGEIPTVESIFAAGLCVKACPTEADIKDGNGPTWLADNCNDYPEAPCNIADN